MTELVKFSEAETHNLLQMDDGKANALSFAMFDALNMAFDQALDSTAHRNSKARIREDFARSYQEALARDFERGEVMGPP